MFFQIKGDNFKITIITLLFFLFFYFIKFDFNILRIIGIPIFEWGNAVDFLNFCFYKSLYSSIALIASYECIICLLFLYTV